MKNLWKKWTEFGKRHPKFSTFLVIAGESLFILGILLVLSELFWI